MNANGRAWATRLAPAKINLWLHVLGRRADGYHELDSLVAFAEIGDQLEAEASRGLSLTLDGPFGPELDSGGDNLVLRAALGLSERVARTGAQPGARPLGAALRLDKRLPVASGIGGGSADAAAALTLLMELWRAPIAADALHELALSLGSDVPVCLAGPGPMRLRGAGERVDRAPPLPDCALLLVNPGARLSTPQVFAALERRENPPPAPLAGPITDLDALAAALAQTRNDLEAPACALAPEIATARAALQRQPGCRFARMSGSGATCFGLFATLAAAREAEAEIIAAQPLWWTGVGRVMGA